MDFSALAAELCLDQSQPYKLEQSLVRMLKYEREWSLFRFGLFYFTVLLCTQHTRCLFTLRNQLHFLDGSLSY